MSLYLIIPLAHESRSGRLRIAERLVAGTSVMAGRFLAGELVIAV